MLLAIEIVVWVILFVLALRGARWAYAIFLMLAFVWIPARTGFHLHRPPCQMRFTLDLALNSLSKYKHISLWTAFFVMTWVQIRRRRHALLIAAIATIAIGVLIELEEGATGTGRSCERRQHEVVARQREGAGYTTPEARPIG